MQVGNLQFYIGARPTLELKPLLVSKLYFANLDQDLLYLLCGLLESFRFAGRIENDRIDRVIRD